MAPVWFWSNPIQYMRWAARAKPAIFWSIWVGSLGPVLMVVAPPLRARFGDGPRQQIPLTYPSEFRRYFLVMCWSVHACVYMPKKSESKIESNFIKLTLRMAVPKGPRKIPEGYDD